MISADKTISTNKLITTDRMAGKEKNSGRNKLTDGKAERVKATATEALPVVRGELALLIVLVINSLGVVLMLYSGSGISAISSVPYAFSEVFSKVSLGVWTDIFQTILVLSLMILRKKFVPQYLLSFIVGAGFGTEIDIHETWSYPACDTAAPVCILFCRIPADQYRNCPFQPL